MSYKRVVAGVLALLAYIPALTAAPGRMPADSKLYLYLDPGRFMGDASSSFDPRQFAGWVPHQHVAYLWPSGTWFWLFDTIGAPDWIAHRLWIGTLMLAAGLGVVWCSRLLGLVPLGAAVAGILYQVGPYVLPYVSRTSVMLLPWAGLGWLVGFTIRAGRRRTWGDPAAIVLIVLTVGAVNATALAMIVPGPTLWLVHSTWQRTVTWRQSLAVAGRVAVLTVPVCTWWVAMLLIQGRYGAEVLPYSESLRDVSLTSTGPEVWRGLGYWLFYVRDSYAAATTESLRYLSSSVAIVISYLVPIACLAGLVWVRWVHRRFAALLIGAGLVLAVGVHPIDHRSPLMRLLAGGDDGGLALALRSSTRALPLASLGLALLGGASVAACPNIRLRRPEWAADRVVAGGLVAVAVLNLPSLWTGAFVDPALERDQDPPDAWLDAAERLDSNDGRVLQFPGAEFGAFRWGYTVDQPLPGLTDAPLVTRDLLPLGSAAAMDLLYALDDRIQDGAFEAEALAPVARWLGVDTVWLANDLAYDRFRTARPQQVGEHVAAAPDIGTVEHFGVPVADNPSVPIVDEWSLARPDLLGPAAPVDLYPIEPAGEIVRAKTNIVIVSGSGDGLVDLAGAGLLEGNELVRYSASLDDRSLAEALAQASVLFVTDSNRDRARQWRGSQDATGYTESDQPGLELLRSPTADARLPVFADTEAEVDPATQTLARQIGPVTATATSYGEPFAYLPEQRPYMAIDGDLATAWRVGGHADPVGEVLRLSFDEAPESITVVQASAPDERRITEINMAGQSVVLTDASLQPEGQTIAVTPGTTVLDIAIDAVEGGTPGTSAASAPVGFADVSSGVGPTTEVVRVPVDGLAAVEPSTPVTIALTRQRVDPMDRWRADPEPQLVRQIELADARPLTSTVEVRVDRRASDADLAGMFDWPAYASSRLTGSIANAGVAALDGDPDTSWITGFDDALGATLTIESATHPIDQIVLTQPSGDFSAITEVTLRSGGEERVITLPAAAVDPPLPAGTLEIEITGIQPYTTVDRRFGDAVELPAAISEVTAVGLPTAAHIADASMAFECMHLIAADGPDQTYRYSFTVTGAQAVAGTAVTGQPCDPAVELATGNTRLFAVPTPVPIDVDRLVLTDAGSDVREGAAPTVQVVEDGRFDRSVEVSGCPDGCWLVLGEGFNTAWSASGPDGSLGEPQLVDGGFNGWWLDGSDAAITIDLHWTQQRKLDVALLITLVGTLAALVVLVIDRRRQPEYDLEQTSPMLTTGNDPLPRRRAIWLAVTWAVLGGLLVAPVWAVVGGLAGLVVVVVRRTRLVELTALSIVATIGMIVTVQERRVSPLPNGGWPAVFASWHELAVFAIVAVLVAGLFADDADPA